MVIHEQYRRHTESKKTESTSVLVECIFTNIECKKEGRKQPSKLPEYSAPEPPTKEDEEEAAAVETERGTREIEERRCAKP